MSDPGGKVNQSNLTDADGSTPCDQVDTTAHIFFLLFYSLVFLVGLLLNGYTLKLYFCGAQQQASKSMTVYLKNLAAADFLISLCLPIRITNYVSRSVAVRRLHCTFGISLFFLNIYASILFLGYIAANRYLKIVHPLGTHVLQTVRAAHIVSMVTWGFLLATATTLITLSLITEEPRLSIPDVINCDALNSKLLILFYKAIDPFAVTIFLLVLVALVFFYHSTARRLAVAQQRQQASPGSRKLARSRRNMLVLVSVFCVCFVPFHLFIIPYTFLWRRCSLTQLFFYLKELTIMLSTLNICLDPLIYFIFCKAFRAQMWHRHLSGGTPDAMVGGTTLGDATLGFNAERRSSDSWMSAIRINRKTSLTTIVMQTSRATPEHT